MHALLLVSRMELYPVYLMCLDLFEDAVFCQPYLAHAKAEGILSQIKAQQN